MQLKNMAPIPSTGHCCEIVKIKVTIMLALRQRSQDPLGSVEVVNSYKIKTRGNKNERVSA